MGIYLSEFTYELPVSEDKFLNIVITELNRNHSDISWEALRTAKLSIEDLGTSYYVDNARDSRWNAKGIYMKFALPYAAIDLYDRDDIHRILFDTCRYLIPSEVGFDIKGIRFIPDLMRDVDIHTEIDQFTTIDVLSSSSLQILTDEIKRNLLEGKPELALDRLHTFSTRFFRELCKNYMIAYRKEDGLHTLFKNYREHLESRGLIESNMTLQLLKVYTNVLNAYNQVRNNTSYAHDNPVLNSIESKFICNQMLSILKFVDEVEEIAKKQNSLLW